nr:PREDICTED: uncharacterized protein LOC107397508 isoform X1 [Tribolium castaneum]XP_015833336.1 PREDICTED: uncharacterized protein LOC107397508 isoform X1 [Tribolium castaneum]XP_015833337.1 PREDICTED: uncharacterized protein LOC107397508 isoform X1 [Tribolium castaneum]|eukprot:XP_015833335.1 PREDICTED: uncharacterized protein LOC107397508 isoform X1 [Tribolium castaneum]
MEPKTFFWYFKPIALICKAVGIFPLQNLGAKHPKELRGPFLSFAQLYSFGVFAFNIYMIWYFSGFMFTTQNSFYLFSVVYVMIFRSIFCFVFCARHSKKLPKLIQLLDLFDRKKRPILVDPKSSYCFCYFFTWTILPIVIGFVTIAFSFYESMNVVLETMPPEMSVLQTKLSACFFGCLATWQVLPLLLYIYFAFRITYDYRILNKTMKTQCHGCCFLSEEIKYSSDFNETLEYVRQMHNLLTKAVEEMGKCYGNFMAIDQLCLIVMVIANICTFISNNGTHEIHLLAITFFNLWVVVWVLVISNEIKEAGNKVIYVLRAIVLSGVDERARIEVSHASHTQFFLQLFQIQTFMMQLVAQPVEVSAAGYFIIDKRQIPSVSKTFRKNRIFLFTLYTNAESYIN